LIDEVIQPNLAGSMECGLNYVVKTCLEDRNWSSCWSCFICAL